MNYRHTAESFAQIAALWVWSCALENPNAPRSFCRRNSSHSLFISIWPAFSIEGRSAPSTAILCRAVEASYVIRLARIASGRLVSLCVRLPIIHSGPQDHHIGFLSPCCPAGIRSLCLSLSRRYRLLFRSSDLLLIPPLYLF